jgi:hypothetical protein
MTLARIEVAQRRGDAVAGVDLEQGGRHARTIDKERAGSQPAVPRARA